MLSRLLLPRMQALLPPTVLLSFLALGSNTFAQSSAYDVGGLLTPGVPLHFSFSPPFEAPNLLVPRLYNGSASFLVQVPSGATSLNITVDTIAFSNVFARFGVDNQPGSYDYKAIWTADGFQITGDSAVGPAASRRNLLHIRGRDRIYI